MPRFLEGITFIDGSGEEIVINGPVPLQRTTSSIDGAATYNTLPLRDNTNRFQVGNTDVSSTDGYIAINKNYVDGRISALDSSFDIASQYEIYKIEQVNGKIVEVKSRTKKPISGLFHITDGSLAVSLSMGGALIDWGDGTLNNSNIHIYQNQGNYSFYIYSDSVTSIGNAAFFGCSSLTSITIPDSVIRIGDRAFWGCSSLTSVTIGNSVTSIGISAFYDCSSLTSITIPNSVTSIGISAFYDCSSLTSITIPNSVTSIGFEAFCDCSSLTSITIPNSVTSIGISAFYDCSSLTSITIPDSVTSIGASAFEGCSSLIIYFAGSSSDDDSWSVNYNPDHRPIYYNCEPVDLSKYTIIKTSDASVQGSDGVIVLVTSS